MNNDKKRLSLNLWALKGSTKYHSSLLKVRFLHDASISHLFQHLNPQPWIIERVIKLVISMCVSTFHLELFALDGNLV